MYVDNSFGDFGKIKWANVFDPLKLREKIGPIKKWTEKNRAKKEQKGIRQVKAKQEEIKQIQEIEKVTKAEEAALQEATKKSIVESSEYTKYVVIGGIGFVVIGGAILYYYKYMRK